MNWVGGDSKERIVEEMTEEGHVFRLEGGRGKVHFSFGEVATWQGLVLGMHEVRMEKWAQGKRVVCCEEG